MKRVLLDTNIYGELAIDKDYIFLKEQIKSVFVVKGFRVVRKEIRDVPKQIKVDGKNFRIAIPHIYDELTCGKEYESDSNVKNLAENYYETYKEIGGSAPKEKIITDFMIIACASIYQMDIVISNDNKTMLNEYSKKAYIIVNKIKKLKMPNFMDYKEFKRLLIL